VWAFRVYKAVPFLWEMKVIIDWTVTSTCLDLFQWFKLDDAFNYLYQCQIQNKDRGQKREYLQRPWYEKFFQGFCFAFALILVILAPILLFSGINPIMVKNPVLSGQMQMSLELNQNGNSYSILHTQAFNIQRLDESDFGSLTLLFSEGSTKFEREDMQKMYFSPYSEMGWSISPPSLQKFIDDYNQLQPSPQSFFEVKTSWSFKRENPIGNEQTGQEIRSRLLISQLQPVIDLLSQKRPSENATGSTSRISVPNVFPKLLKLGGTQQSHIMDAISLS
jgi:piezo-type mechanosensitive ion channel component 1/2